MSTERALKEGGWVSLTDAFFDCDQWTIGSGRVPIRHPVPTVALQFDRESVCHGHRAEFVSGVLDGPPGSTRTLMSLAPIDDPVLLGCIAILLLLLAGAVPVGLLRTHTRAAPKRRPLADLQSPSSTALHREFWVHEGSGLALAGLVCALALYGLWFCGIHAWRIQVAEPRAWALGQPRAPARLDDREHLWVTWMEGKKPAAVSIDMPLTIRLDAPFLGRPEVRVGPDRTTATNVGLHYTNSRLVFLGEWLLLCLMLGIPSGITLVAGTARLVRWSMAARNGDVQFLWVPVLKSEMNRHYGVPTHRRLTVHVGAVGERVLSLPATREPVLRRAQHGQAEVLVATADGLPAPLPVAWDGYPFTRTARG